MDREQQIRQLQLDLGEARADSAVISVMPERLSTGDRARLEQEIHDLRQELLQVRERHRSAEERCALLERQLNQAEFWKAQDAVSESNDLQSQELMLERLTVMVGGGDNPRPRGNGLLLTPKLAVTMSYVVQKSDADVWVRRGPHKVNAELIETFPSATPTIGDESPYPSVSLLKVGVPMTDTRGGLELDRRPDLGSRLLLMAYTDIEGTGRVGPSSCMLTVAGRYGEWIRVEGSLEQGVGGAPAMDIASHRIVGLVAKTRTDRTGGLLVPLTALGALRYTLFD
ncbi:hypothetical protein [Streptomyces sp. B6B3]|uniref:hypothetical protein n=1 Tax=Streptomyces sp. B6B3 TaxID=3153570 RepID=UPI00325D7A74